MHTPFPVARKNWDTDGLYCSNGRFQSRKSGWETEIIGNDFVTHCVVFFSSQLLIQFREGGRERGGGGEGGREGEREGGEANMYSCD